MVGVVGLVGLVGVVGLVGFVGLVGLYFGRACTSQTKGWACTWLTKGGKPRVYSVATKFLLLRSLPEGAAQAKSCTSQWEALGV